MGRGRQGRRNQSTIIEIVREEFDHARIETARPVGCGAAACGRLRRAGAERLSEQADPADRRLHAGLGRPTSPRACSATAWARFSASRSWSRTGPAPARTSPPNSSPARRRTATRCSCGASANIANAAINPNLPFDIAKDFAPIALVNTVAVILVVHPSLGVNNVQELIALAKSKPGELSYASTGHRQRAASVRRAVHAARRHQARARALSRAARRRRPICSPAASR